MNLNLNLNLSPDHESYLQVEAEKARHEASRDKAVEEVELMRRQREANLTNQLRKTEETRQQLRPSDIVDTNDVLEMGDRLAYLSNLGKMAEREGRGEDVAKVQHVTRKIVQRNLDHVHHEGFRSPFSTSDSDSSTPSSSVPCTSQHSPSTAPAAGPGEP